MWTFFPNVLPWNYPYAAFSSNSCIFNLMFCLLEILENKWRYYEDLNIIWNKEKRYKMKPSMWSTIVIHCTIVLYSNGFDNNKKKGYYSLFDLKAGTPKPSHKFRIYFFKFRRLWILLYVWVIPIYRYLDHDLWKWISSLAVSDNTHPNCYQKITIKNSIHTHRRKKFIMSYLRSTPVLTSFFQIQLNPCQHGLWEL